MRLKVILDGYNVIGKIARLARILDEDGLERSREALAAMLAGLTGQRGGREFVIVFDGQGADEALPATCRIRGIKCHFSRRGTDADDLIGELLAGIKDRRQVAVISADNKVANKCKVYGVPVDHPSILCEPGKKRPAAHSAPAKEIPADKAGEITKWYMEKLAG